MIFVVVTLAVYLHRWCAVWGARTTRWAGTTVWGSHWTRLWSHSDITIQSPAEGSTISWSRLPRSPWQRSWTTRRRWTPENEARGSPRQIWSASISSSTTATKMAAGDFQTWGRSSSKWTACAAQPTAICTNGCTGNRTERHSSRSWKPWWPARQPRSVTIFNGGASP